MEAENGRGTTLVLGGTGKTGSGWLGRLEARGLHVRIGSRQWRSRRSIGRSAPRGRRRSRDVGSVYVAYYPDLAVPGAADAVRVVR